MLLDGRDLVFHSLRTMEKILVLSTLPGIANRAHELWLAEEYPHFGKGLHGSIPCAIRMQGVIVDRGD
jgi:hypothetical protein